MNLLTHRYSTFATLFLAVGLLGSSLCVAQSGESFALSREVIVTGLTRSVAICAPRDDLAHLFIVEQYVSGAGRVRVVDLVSKTLLPTPFLVIPGVSTASEQGLLGLCFHPQHAANGHFFVNYVKDGHTIVDRYTVSPTNPLVADPLSRKLILSIARTANNHNSGWMEFGPDGYLYIGVGDGAQSTAPLTMPESPLGRILRIDINSEKPYVSPPSNPWVGVPGIDSGWATGLRNPWRCAFDRISGELWVADVGKNAWEEISVIPAGIGGIDLGWPCWEGTVQNYVSTTCPDPASQLFPIHTYEHSLGNCAIVGGRVYRGPESVELRGTYFFADLCSKRIWTLQRIPGEAPLVIDRSAQLQGTGQVSSFGEDAQGNIYFCVLGGTLVRIKVQELGCPADFDSNGAVDAGDLSTLLAYWNHTGVSRFDLDGSGTINSGDLSLLLAYWGDCS